MSSCAFISIDDFVESCRKVFFATEDYSMETFIIVNAGLVHLFEEKSATGDSMSEEYVKYHYLCRDNLETALANLPFFLHPRKETIEALLLGVGIQRISLLCSILSLIARSLTQSTAPSILWLGSSTARRQECVGHLDGIV
jgi:hypothetical protein